MQVGHFHVNMKTNEEVVMEMQSHGFLYDAETTQRLRTHSRLAWLTKTVMVFHNITRG